MTSIAHPRRLLIAALCAAGLAAPARPQQDEPRGAQEQPPQHDEQRHQQDEARARPGQGTPAPAGSVDLLKASAVLGASVQDENGQPVGRVHDVVLDEQSGQIVAVLLDPHASLAGSGAGSGQGAGARPGEQAGRAGEGRQDPEEDEDDDLDTRYDTYDEDESAAAGRGGQAGQQGRPAAGRQDGSSRQAGMLELVPLPISLVQPGDDTTVQDGVASPTTLKLTVGKDKLASAPRISVERPLDGDNLVAVHEFFAVPVVWQTNPNLRQGGQQPRPRSTAQGGPQQAGEEGVVARPLGAVHIVVADAGLVLLSEIVDRQVAGMQGDPLGEIEDVALSLKSRDVAYAVLERPDAQGEGSKRFAVPWQALDRQGERVTLDVSPSALERATGFSDEWPREPDSELFESGGRTSPGTGGG